MFRRQSLLEVDEVKHLPDEVFPLQAVLVWLEQHAEVVWHMRVDSLYASIEEQVTICKMQALFRFHGHWHSRINVELWIVVGEQVFLWYVESLLIEPV